MKRRPAMPRCGRQSPELRGRTYRERRSASSYLADSIAGEYSVESFQLPRTRYSLAAPVRRGCQSSPSYLLNVLMWAFGTAVFDYLSREVLLMPKNRGGIPLRN